MSQSRSPNKKPSKRKSAVARRRTRSPPGGQKDVEAKVPSGLWSRLSYAGLYRADALERIGLIRRGISAADAKRLFADLGFGQGAAFKALNLSTATVNKKAKQGDALARDEGERIVGFARLLGQVEVMVQTSGEPAGFDARSWMKRWLDDPVPALGGARPADLIDTMEGQGLVSAVLAQMQSGAYA